MNFSKQELKDICGYIYSVYFVRERIRRYSLPFKLAVLSVCALVGVCLQLSTFDRFTRMISLFVWLVIIYALLNELFTWVISRIVAYSLLSLPVEITETTISRRRNEKVSSIDIKDIKYLELYKKYCFIVGNNKFIALIPNNNEYKDFIQAHQDKIIYGDS